MSQINNTKHLYRTYPPDKQFDIKMRQNINTKNGVQDISTRHAVWLQNETEDQLLTWIEDMSFRQAVRHQNEAEEQHHT